MPSRPGARPEPRQGFRPAAGESSLTDTLCTRCGLCCDGTLFADVELARGAEAARLEILGARIDESGDRPSMLLPCAALCGTRCGVYPHRPSACRSFECGLLGDVRRGAVTVERALVHVAEALEHTGRAKALLARLGHRDASLPLGERSAEALASESGGEAALRTRAELAATMAGLKRSMRAFLAGSRRR